VYDDRVERFDVKAKIWENVETRFDISLEALERIPFRFYPSMTGL